MKTLTVKEIVMATGGCLLTGSETAKVCSVSTDSRQVGEADVFFAIVGERFDGHDFLAGAAGGGCKTMVISDRAKGEALLTAIGETAAASAAGGGADAGAFAAPVNLILVDDTVKALQQLAKYYMGLLPLKKKIAVTGSVGKTSTRDMLYYIADSRYNAGRNQKNFNNELGLPLTILSFDETIEVAVLEMGMDSFGEIDALADIVRPDIAVITNIGVSHIENLGSREGIRKAKMEVTNYFTPDCTLVVNQACDLLQKEDVAGAYQLLTAGEDGKSDFIVSNICDFGDKGIKYTLDRNHNQYEVKLPVPGAHNAMNATLAIAAGEAMGIPPEEAIAALSHAELTAKRLNIRGKDGIKVIDDTYNACPDSMRSAINTLLATKGLRKVAILGDMYELGAESPKFHYQVGQYAGTKQVDLLIAVGDAAQQIAKGAEENLDSAQVMYFPTKEEFLQVCDQVITPGDVVLVKASRGMEMEQIVKKIFADKE